jgi:hypothetical protein
MLETDDPFCADAHQHESQRIVGDMLDAEINEKQPDRSSTSPPSPNYRLRRT